jgi:D-xylose transport system ATP-binding protein
MDEPLISLTGVKKSFGPVDVLRGVDLKAYPGKVTALVGDNGAGKSTLIKGLAGVQPYDAGEVRFDGELVNLHNPREASRLGIEVVYQDLALADNLDIVQNMFLGREETRWGTFDEGSMELATSRALQQTVAIARSVINKSRLVVLDEPTAALGVAQTEQVLGLVKRLAEQNVAVIIISHNLADVFKVADYISVLYLGRMVASVRTADTTYDDVVGYITGSKTYAGEPA